MCSFAMFYLGFPRNLICIYSRKEKAELIKPTKTIAKPRISHIFLAKSNFYCKNRSFMRKCLFPRKFTFQIKTPVLIIN